MFAVAGFHTVVPDAFITSFYLFIFFLDLEYVILGTTEVT